jgi:hypothetical protein
MMDTIQNSQSAFHRSTESVFAMLTPEQTKRLAEMQADPQLAARIEILADKANEGQLSPEERAEYEGYINANYFLATLQAEARFRLNPRPSASSVV